MGKDVTVEEDGSAEVGSRSPLLDKISQSPFHGYKATKKDNSTPIHIE